MDNFSKTINNYVLSLTVSSSKEVCAIERGLTVFENYMNGYSNAALEAQWPVLKPNYTIEINNLVPFHEAYSRECYDGIVHFFTNDMLFMRLFRNPEKYLPFLKKCKGVIGTDVSQFSDMPEEMRRRHAYCNVLMSWFLQQNGVNVVPNITWSLMDSFDYSFPQNLRGSVIAINSNGVHSSDLALHRWKTGYRKAVELLDPKMIIRYGQHVDGELDDISSFYCNERLKMLRHGR